MSLTSFISQEGVCGRHPTGELAGCEGKVQTVSLQGMASGQHGTWAPPTSQSLVTARPMSKRNDRSSVYK